MPKWNDHRRSRRRIGQMTAERFLEHSRIERARKARPRVPRKPRVRTEAQIAAAAERSKTAAERKEARAERALAVMKCRAQKLLSCEAKCQTKHGPCVSHGKRVCADATQQKRLTKLLDRRLGELLVFLCVLVGIGSSTNTGGAIFLALTFNRSGFKLFNAA